MIYETQSAQISQKQDENKDICRSCASCTSCARVHESKQIVVITGRAHCLRDNICNIFIYIYIYIYIYIIYQNFNQATSIQQSNIIN